MANKEFKTIDEQLSILLSRGLSVPDKEKAKTFLINNNYYRISGYSLTLRKNDLFDSTASFQNIIDIYNFDHEFRHIILEYIEIIEVRFKSIFAYEFSKEFGPTGYLYDNNFTDKTKHKEIIDKANVQKSRRLDNEAYLKHFVYDLNQDIPLWAFVDLLTISDISFLYSISNVSIMKSIACYFGLNETHGSKILGKYMHSMTIIRNLCAHGGRIYNRLFEQKPSLNKLDKSLLITDLNGEVDNSHFYGFFLVMRRLLPSEIFKEMKSRIITLNDKYPFVRMDFYGFRSDWQSRI